MDKRNNDFDFDFRPLGLAIKKARKAQPSPRRVRVSRSAT